MGRNEARVPQMLVALTFIGTLLLGGSWALLTPIGAVPDEVTHTIRAVSLWHGDVVGRRFVFSDAGPPPVEATMFEVSMPAGYEGIVGIQSCYTGPTGGSADCAPLLMPAEGERLMATIAGAYPPLPYGVYGWASRVVSPTETIYLGRLLSAVVAAAFVAAGAACAWIAGGRRLVAALVVSLTPTAAWLFGAINPSGIEIAAALALWPATMALVRRPEHRGVAAVVALAATGVAWSRPLAPVMAVGIITAALLLTADRAALRALWTNAAGRVAGLAAAVSIATAAVWIVATQALSTFIASPNPALTPGVAAAGSWEESPNRLRQMVGLFGLLETRPPGELWWAWGLAVLVLLLAGLWCGTGRQRAMLLALVAATLGLPVIAEATTAAELGYTWQGRYTMPVAIGALLAAGWATVHGRRRLPRAGTIPLMVVLGGVAIFGHVLAPLAATARFARGQGSGLLGWFDAAPWTPPGPDLLLLATAALGVVLVSAILLLRTPAARPAAVLPQPPRGHQTQ